MAFKDLQWILRHGRLNLITAPMLYRCEPIWSWTERSLSEYALLLTLEGRGQVLVNNELHPLRQGVCLFLQPDSRIEAQQDPSYPLFLFIARFDVEDTDTHASDATTLQGSGSPESVFIRNTRSIETLAELIASRGGAGKSDTLTTDAISMLIRLLVEEATRHAGRFDAQAYEALRAIENDLARKWTIKDLAAEAGLSSGTFARSFKLMMNEPPVHYVVQRRMEEAKRQIQQSSLSVEEIAANLGYDDMSFFRELFRNRIGSVPEEFRSNRPF